MGFFSWKTQDTNKSIANKHSDRPTFKVVMHDNKANKWIEEDYDGYGVFGGKDYYELLAEMNGQEGRSAGISIEFGDKPFLAPNLTESEEWEWQNEKPYDCPDQGYFYDDFDDL